jgi:hypothetical protein
MGNFFSDIGTALFGGSESGSSSSSGGSKYTAEQQELLKKMISQYSGYIGTATPTYSGELVAPTTQTQKDILQNLLNYESPTSSLSGVTNQSLSDIISGNSALPSVLTKQYEEGIEKPLLKSYTETIVPELQGSFASKGLSYGSSKQDALNTASSNLEDALAKGRADLNASITEKTIANQLAGITASNETSATSLAQILGLSSAENTLATQEQTTSQAQDTAAYEQWLRNQPGTNPAENMIMQILGLYPEYAESTSTSESTSVGANTMAPSSPTCWVWTYLSGENGSETISARNFRNTLFGKNSLVKSGYEVMGKVVYPLMVRFKPVKWLVRKCIYEPINKIVAGNNSKHLIAVGYAWKFVWENLGKIKELSKCLTLSGNTFGVR